MFPRLRQLLREHQLTRANLVPIFERVLWSMVGAAFLLTLYGMRPRIGSPGPPFSHACPQCGRELSAFAPHNC